MKFLLEIGSDGHFAYDFVFVAHQVVLHLQWKDQGHQSSQCTLSTLKSTYSKEWENHYPIGSLDFVFAYAKMYDGVENSLPINVPPALCIDKFLKREYFIHDIEADIQVPLEGYFIKDASRYKGFTEIVYPGEEKNVPFNRPLIVSGVVDIDSEWRVFVLNDHIVGVKNYSLSDSRLIASVVPDMDLVQEMVDTYYQDKSAPYAYTLDVGVNSSGTFIIEVHPFVSCGLYGFQDMRYLPAMYVSGYRYLKHSMKPYPTQSIS